MKTLWKCTIQCEPRTKKNSQNIFVNKKTGRAFISTSAAYKAYDSEFAKCVSGKEPKEPIACEVEVKCTFYMKTRRRVDLTNLLEAAHDLMTKHGILADDNSNVVVSVDGSRVSYDKENPRTEIEVYEVEK